MGNTKNTAGKRIYNDIYSFPQDLQDLADDVHAAWNVRPGTSAERQAFPPAQLREGLIWIETDTRSTRQWFSATGWIGQSLGTVFRRTSAYNFTNAGAVVAWNAEDFKSDDFSHSSGTMTFTRAGTYLISFCITIGAAASAGIAGATLRKNGASIAQPMVQRSTAGPVGITATLAVQVVAGDSLTLDAVSTGATIAADSTTGRNFISITPIR